MTPAGHSRACERARTWAALAPDGELSQLEVRLLQAHLERCPACARVAVDIEAISEAIRAAPLEPPPAQIALPVLRRRSLRHRLPVTPTASRLAAVAAVGLLAFTVGSWSSDRVASTSLRPIVIDETTLPSAEAERAEFRAYRRAALMSGTYVGQHEGSRTGVRSA